MAPGIAVLIPLITGLNIAMLANPAVLIAVAIIALVAAGVLLYKNWDKVQDVARRVWQAVGQYVEDGVNIVIDILNIYTLAQRKALTGLLKGVRAVANALGQDLPDALDDFIDAVDEGIPHVDIFTKKTSAVARASTEAAGELEAAGISMSDFGEQASEVRGRIG